MKAFNSDDDDQSELRHVIVLAKELLPLRDLIEKLGDRDRVLANRCPFHDDEHPSFSIFDCDGAELWKCHAGCGAGDEINYLETKFDLTRGEAIEMFLQMAGVSNPGGGKFYKDN